MASRILARRLAMRVSPVLRESGVNSGSEHVLNKAGREEARSTLSKGARRDPELYTLGLIMTGAFGMAGYYFASKPTSATSEVNVTMAENSAPWESGTSGKYQYHPGGDRSTAPKDAPSALHSVTVPNVNLPKHLHEQFNKYEKDEFDDY